MSDKPKRGVGLVLDCRDPERLARFWSAALDYVSLGELGNYYVLFPDGRPGSKLLLQRVTEEKAGKNRMHIDIEVADVGVEVSRLESLGAKRLEPESRTEHGVTWQVMADPEGNEFCVCDG
jgi:predicted enzyme related to lactoylglutathione lyase